MVVRTILWGGVQLTNQEFVCLENEKQKKWECLNKCAGILEEIIKLEMKTRGAGGE